MKKIILGILGNILCLNVFNAQIGINTATPDETAAIDIQSPANEVRGALLPRVSRLERLSITNPAPSLLVFDTDEKIFYYFDGNRWVGLLPKENPNSSYPNNNTPDVSPKVKGDLIIDSGRVQTPNLYVSGFSNNALVPTGAIVMWSGSIANIPSGWALCNGGLHVYNLNGNMAFFPTPDLQGKFIAGYDPSNTDYSTIGNSSGTNQVTLEKANLPRHQHTIGEGSDGGTFSQDGNHSHQVGYISQDRSGGNTGTDIVRGYPGNAGNVPTSVTGAHRHTGTTGNGTSDGLNAQPFDNRPVYYVLAYIIKLP